VAPTAGITVGAPGGGSTGQGEDRNSDLAVLAACGATVLALRSARIPSGADDRVVLGVHDLLDHPD